MGLSTRLFLSIFLITALLFSGLYFYLKGYNQRIEQTRASESFARTIVHYTNAQAERQQALSQAASLLARDFAFKEAVSTRHTPTIASALESQKLRAKVDITFFLDSEGKALSVLGEGKPALDLITKATARMLEDGVPVPAPPYLQLGEHFYQVTLAPVLAPSHVGTIGIGYRISKSQMTRLSDATGLQHVLLRTEPTFLAETGYQALTEADFPKLAAISAKDPSEIRLSGGNFLAKSLPIDTAGSWRLLLLFPLNEFELASRELTDAFLLAGMVLFLLATLLSQLLSRELARPFGEVQATVRRIANEVGLEVPESTRNEARQIAVSYIQIASRLSEELGARQLALEELKAYRAELLEVNKRLHTRLFQVKVMLSLWTNQSTASNVKEYLRGFLDVLLPGLPFRWGCAVIRPLAELDGDMIFAEVLKKKKKAAARHLDDEPDHDTQWTSPLDAAVKDFLLQESQRCMTTEGVTVTQAMLKLDGNEERQISVVSLRLQQGDVALGSLHFLNDDREARLNRGLFDFILNLSNQVATQLQVHALSYSVRIDALTRLYNRGYMNERLTEELARSVRTQGKFSFVLIDVDHFKKVNDTYGHQAGDDVLRGMANLLKRICRASDAICRYGGEEIAILLTDTALAGAKIFAENVRLAVEKENFEVSAGGALKVTVSMGISEFPGNAATGQGLIACADEALYAAKKGGRNQWRSADEFH